MSRRKARVLAIQYIYSKEFNEDNEPDEFLGYMNGLKKESDIQLSKEIMKGVLENLYDIDSIIDKHIQNSKERMGIVERCILRAGIYEMLYLNNLPNPIIINEYIDITKELSKESSKAVINAILDKAKEEKV